MAGVLHLLGNPIGFWGFAVVAMAWLGALVVWFPAFICALLNCKFWDVFLIFLYLVIAIVVSASSFL